MNRRDFLSATAGATGYSLFVRVDDLHAAPAVSVGRSADDIRKEMDRIAPRDRQAAPAERNMTLLDLTADILVAGGGLAGVCAAISAARNGAKVVLVQDRSRLGGNSSSEIKMHVVGANSHGGRPGWREGGLLEEIRLDNAANNPQSCWELWDLLLYDKVVSEPNITLLLDTAVYSAEVKDGTITRVQARCDRTEHIYRISAKQFIDCTGDSRLALEAGAEFLVGHEAREEFGESLAPKEANRETQGCSILFTARDFGKPMPFTPPKWARKITDKQLKHRGVGKTSWEYGYWWIEWGGQKDTVHDNERIRFELLGIVLGVWDHIKNSGKYPAAASWALDWVGMLPGKREARRIVGDYMLTQNDIMGTAPAFDDAVCIGGWPLDEHPSSGFDNPEVPPFTSIKIKDVYNIPLRSLTCKSISNLMMAGRNISATHTAFSSTRVMATCAVEGQAAGTAAALAIRDGVGPKQIYADKARLRELQQRLLRDDQTIKGMKNDDATDLARTAKVSASGVHESGQASNVINGWTRDLPGKFDNKWAAPLEGGVAWLELAWDRPQRVGEVQLVFDSGFHRELTLSSSANTQKGMILAPQPETVRDYVLQVRSPSGEWRDVATVTGNHQRLKRHRFDAVEVSAVRVRVSATNGNDQARIFEVRCYV